MTSHHEIEEQFREAAQDGDLETVRRLVERENVNVNVANYGGYTALMKAIRHGYKEIVELLLDNGANVKDVDDCRDTALIYASKNGYKEVVELLLDNDVNVNTANIYGFTGLIYASERGHKEIVEMLLDKNAKTNIANTWGEIALCYAKQNGYSEIVVLILDYEIAKLEDKLDRGMSPQDTKTKNQELLEKAQLRKQFKTIWKREQESHSDSSRPQKRSRLSLA